MSAIATEQQNTVTISDAGPCRKKLAIEIPAEVVTGKLKESMDVMSNEAQVPGFRKGKVPKALLEKRFGPSLRSEAKSQLVSAAFQKAVEQNNLKVVGDPTSDSLAKIELQPGKPFAFEIEVEVMPTFDLPPLDGIKVIKPLIDVTDEMIDREVMNLRVNDGELASRDVAEPGDYITGHARMTTPDGKEHYNIQGAVVQSPTPDKNGKGMILGVMVDDFSKQLGSPKPGDTFTIRTQGPENHEVESLRNQSLTITFSVDRIDRIIPAPIEKILTAFGFDNEQSLRDAIRQRLDQRIMVQQQVAMRQQIAKHLSDNTKMELPERMTAGQAARTLERSRLELMYRGMQPTQIEERMAQLRSASSAAASRDLKLFFILNRIAEDFGVRVDENEINNRIYQIAMERSVRPERLRQEMIQNGQINGIFAQIREHKTFDQILARAEFSEMPAAEFNKKMAAEEKVGT